jgi:CRP-like cAMP-binding protein
VLGSAYAVGEVTTVHVARDKMADLVQQNPHLLQELGRTIEQRRADVRAALEQTADTDVAVD